MVGIFEKITWALAGLVLLAIGGYYFVFGAPSAIPAIAMQSRVSSKAEVTKELGEGQRKLLLEDLRASPREGDSQKQYERIKEEYRRNTRAIFERVANPTDAIHEAKKISSEVVENKDGTNSLKVFDFDENTALGNLGFQENDVIDYIGGEKIDFSSTIQARELFYDMRSQIESTGFLKIDIRRRNKPMKIVVTLD